MSLEVDVTITCSAWSEAIDAEPEFWSQRAAEAAIEAAQLTFRDPVEVSVLFCDDAQIRELNKNWRGQDKPTNVLAFPAPFEPGAPVRLLGDVALAYETASREAESEGKSLAQHATHLMVHGVLHLLGYDHETDIEADEMEGCERTALARLGYPDPYAANGEDA